MIINLFTDGQWFEVRDGYPAALQLHGKHYSKYHYRDGRKPRRFVGPGERMVLVTVDDRAAFVWRKFRSMDNQTGINCSFFRNEGPLLSSDLILEAEELARKRWPDERRFYTYVNAKKIKSSNPGYCFKVAGWKNCGYTKKRGLFILEKNVA